MVIVQGLIVVGGTGSWTLVELPVWVSLEKNCEEWRSKNLHDISLIIKHTLPVAPLRLLRLLCLTGRRRGKTCLPLYYDGACCCQDHPFAACFPPPLLMLLCCGFSVLLLIHRRPHVPDSWP